MGTAFNADGGRSFAVKETGFSVNCVSDEKVDRTVFSNRVVCPENPERYRKQVSFTLPDSLSEEEKNAVTDVLATVYRDCTSEAPPEYDQEIRNRLSGAGIQDPSLLYLQSLSYAWMVRDDDQADSYSGTLSGLLCAMEENPDINYVMLETEEGVFLNKRSDVYDTWYLKPKEWLDYPLLDLEYDMKITLRDGTAGLEEFSIDDSRYSVPYSALPLNWIDRLEYTNTALAFTHNEDGSLQMNEIGFYRVNTDVPVDGEQKTLELIPLEDCGSPVRILYIVYFEDGSFRYYDGGTYQ